MSIRKVSFVEDEYYHIFNRGVDKRSIFIDKQDLYYFFNRLVDLNTDSTTYISRDIRRKNSGLVFIDNGIMVKKLVSIVAYCLLPNHFHLILKQEVENGISKFIQKLCTSYVVYFNNKYDRSGSLFQGKFKATHISSEFGLPILSTYVNFNYRHHAIKPENNLVKSSIFEYLAKERGESICDINSIKEVLYEVGGLKEYKKYANDISKYFGENKGIALQDIDFDKIFE